MVVVALDPGVTTGAVTASIGTDVVRVVPHQQRWSAKQLYDALRKIEPEYVICEDFEFRPNSPQGLVMTSAHLIGVVMLYCEERLIPLRMQKASYAKGGFFKPINNLKAAGVYVGGKDHEHAMDAMRHFMQWFTYGPGFKYHVSQPVELVR